MQTGCLLKIALWDLNNRWPTRRQRDLRQVWVTEGFTTVSRWGHGALRSPYQSAGSFPGFLHFAIGSFAEGFQKLVPVLQVVFVVVSLHRLLFHRHLRRSFANQRGFIRNKSPHRLSVVWREPYDTDAVHPDTFSVCRRLFLDAGIVGNYMHSSARSPLVWRKFQRRSGTTEVKLEIRSSPPTTTNSRQLKKLDTAEKHVRLSVTAQSD